MAKLKMVDLIQKKVRWDNVHDVGIPSWDLVEEAIRAGKTGDALELVEYARAENKAMHHGGYSLVATLLDYVARNLGEEAIEKAWGFETNRIPVLSPLEDHIRLWAEFMRGHYSGPMEKGGFTVTEEADRYVLAFDPCGSGGILRRTGMYGVTKKPHPWSWGKAGVPYYCTHCCILFELFSIRDRGYPMPVFENVDRREAPCLHIFYKSPELIPEEYFTRVGFKKDMSKVKK